MTPGTICRNFGDTSFSSILGGFIYQTTEAFKEVAIISHPSIGGYAFRLTTSSVTLQECSTDSRGGKKRSELQFKVEISTMLM
ncbi:unnamed protein product [Lactuca virosa]|uniref:Uncharacterized protein n=1 Tax=Lactuca virosa TaxID=75947 RepID=A0AAU9N0B5_9ASTR|nr:unnamed protein product [Lactuca virosa]